MRPNILKSNLLNPGIKFIATDEVKDTTLPPHSLGFFSYFKNPDRDYQDVAHATVIIIRRGKAGQKRIEHKEISFPIFSDKRMLDHEEYLPVGRKLYIHTKEEPFSEPNLLNIDPLEFLGWCCSYTGYLKHIVQSFIYPTKRANWTEGLVGGVLISADNIRGYFSDNPAETIRSFARAEFRSEFIETVRRLESKLIKCVCSYRKSVTASILNSSHFVEHTNDNHYIVVDKKLAKNTTAFYKEEYDRMFNLFEKNKALRKGRGA